MYDTSVTDGAAPSHAPTVTSILGVKGPLRFRPHGSSQKPHIILRRVVISDGSSDNGEVDNVVCFSFFAQKRIEVKPGKEILLTVASEDGRFGEQPIIFVGEALASDATSDEEVETQVAEEDDLYLPPIGQAIPPKMRRAWTKKVEEVSPLISEPLRYSAVGVQTESNYSSTSTQAGPSYTSSSSQAEIPRFSKSIQVDLPPLRVSSAAQVAAPRRDITVGTQAEQFTLAQAPTPPGRSGGYISSTEQEPGHRRSLSPMELSSPTDSPIEPSPIQHEETPTLSPVIPPSPPPHSPVSSVASSSGGQDMQLSPVELKESAQKFDSTASSSLPTLPPRTNCSEASAQKRALLLPVDTTRALNVTPSYPKPVSDLESTPPAAPPPRIFQNPFVSAGFMVQFNGEASTLSTVASPQQKEIALVETPRTSTPTASSHTYSNPPLLLSINRPRPLTSSNALASSSKTRPPTGPRSLLPLSQRAKEKSPVSSNLHLSTQLAGKILSPSPASQPMADFPADDKRSVWNNLTTQPPGPPSASIQLAKAPRRARIKSGKRRSTRSTPSIAPATPFSSQSPFYSPLSDTPSLSAIIPCRSPSPPQSGRSKNNPSNGASSNIPPFQITESPAPVLSSSVSTQPNPNSHSGHPHLGERMGVIGVDFGSNHHSSNSIQQGIPIPSTQMGPRKRPALNGMDSELGKLNTEERGQPVPNSARSLGSSLSWTSTSCSRSPTEIAPLSKWKSLSLSEPDLSRGQIETCSRSSVEVLEGPQKPNNGHSSKTAVGCAPGTANKDATMGNRNPRYAERSTECTCEFSPDGQLSASSGRRWGRSQHSALCGLWENRKSPDEGDDSKQFPSSTSTTNNPEPPPDSRASPIAHSLPTSPAASRGVKRERPPTPDLSHNETLPRKKRAFNWPTVDSFFSLDLKGDGDLAINNIAFSVDGGYFAIACGDRTVRIWNSRSRTEIARLSHNATVVCVRWMEGDTAVMSLGEDGIISKWTKTGQNQWQWTKVLDTGNKRQAGDDTICLAYMRDRIAVSFPRFGVKVWVWLKGTWQAQRSILRQNVTAIKFVEDGTALLGGTKDGVLWYTEIPNGTLRAFAFLLSRITSIDITPNGSHALIGQEGRAARLVGIRQANRKGSVEQSYACKDAETRFNSTFGAIFATRGEAVLFGCVDGCALVWDRKKGNVVYALEHDDDDQILSIASYDGLTNRDGYLITGTKRGHLAWWLQPAAAPPAQSAEGEGPKRMKYNGS